MMSARFLFLSVAVGGLLLGALLFVPGRGYQAETAAAVATVLAPVSSLPHPVAVRHVATPKTVRAFYMTSCVASGPSMRTRVVDLARKKGNAVVIDVKDFTGTVSFATPTFPADTKGCFVKDMPAFIAELHDDGLYVIGRITTFQDATYPKAHPNTAVLSKSTGAVWHDKKGITYIDPGSTEYWDAVVALAQDAVKIGFDEINFDYIRYPSDGSMSDAAFPRSGSREKAEVIESFFAHLHDVFAQSGTTISGDLFGMTTAATDDMGIGQVLDRALPYFDAVAPMVYPSHYPPGWNGHKNPNTVPGTIVEEAMAAAVLKARALEARENGTTTPISGKYVRKLRAWIQDFEYGGTYDAAAVRAEIAGTERAGVPSWMSWDPSNRYTPAAY